jgi:hypothetical protein
MERKHAIVSIALNSKEKNDLQQLAKMKKTSLSMLFKQALVLYLGFSDDFLKIYHRMASDLGVQPPFVIERMALAYFAELAAEEEVQIEAFGKPLPRALPEFAPGQTSFEFFEAWKDNKVKEIRYHLQGPNYISPAEAELLKYQKEGETVTYEELIRRKHNAEFEAEIAKLPPDKQQKLRAAFQRTETRQKEMRAKHE